MMSPLHEDGQLPFQNREHELDELIDHVTRPQGRRLFLLVGMPTMGKTRLLHRLQHELRARGFTQHHVLYVDLHVDTATGHSLRGLLPRLFPDEPWDGPANDFPAAAARAIARSHKPWVVLLDHADVLLRPVATELRSFLSRTLRKLRAEGLDSQLSLVAASRIEMRAFKGLRPEPGFKTIVLKQFREDVFAKALAATGSELGLHRDPHFYEAAGRQLCHDTAGLPALLGGALARIKHDGFGMPAKDAADGAGPAEWSPLFRAVVKPYLESTLLSYDALLPDSALGPVNAEDHAAIGAALCKLVLATSAFRLVTKSHLKLLAEHHPDLSAALRTIARLGKDPYDVFGSLSIVEPSPELWYAQYAAIRQLYFRYRYLSVDEQVAAHREAQAVYQSWSDMAGVGLARFSVERLWHQAEILRMLAPLDAKQQLRSYLDQVQSLIGEDLHRTFSRRIRIDDELHATLEGLAPGFSKEFLTWL